MSKNKYTDNPDLFYVAVSYGLMLLWAIAFFAVIFLTGCAHGSFHVENDLFKRGKTRDMYYTHGTQFTYTEESDQQKEAYSLGQTIYTPSKKRIDAPVEILERDRPYGGWLYGEYRKTYQTSENIRDIYGIQLGCSGGCSLAKQSQQGVHKLLGQDIPTWNPDFALRSEPGVILERERSYLIASNDRADLSAYGALKAGNIIDSAAFGIDVRAGYALDQWAVDPIIFKKAREQSLWVGYLFGRLEQRIIAYNHFLDGSLFQSERHTVDSELLVQEADFGVTVGYEPFKFTYRYTVLSNEWEERNGSHAFGGLTFQW